MTTVVLERDFEPPASARDLHNAEKQAEWCMSIYGIEPKVHYLAKDGMNCMCVFSAPDAESIRQVARQAAFAPPRRVWSTSIHDPPGSALSWVPDVAVPGFMLSIVERSFDTSVKFADIEAIEARALSCLMMHQVRFVRGYFSCDRRRMLCVYEAPDVKSVRLAYREAGLCHDRVWGAQIVLPATP